MHGSLGLCEDVSSNQATRVLRSPGLPGCCLLRTWGGALGQLSPVHLSVHPAVHLPVLHIHIFTFTCSAPLSVIAS